MPLDLEQAWLLALVAAQNDDRLALLHLGHLHHQGVDGFPTDQNLAYAYYANIAKQTVSDRQSPTPQQVMHFLDGVMCKKKIKDGGFLSLLCPVYDKNHIADKIMKEKPPI